MSATSSLDSQQPVVICNLWQHTYMYVMKEGRHNVCRCRRRGH